MLSAKEVIALTFLQRPLTIEELPNLMDKDGYIEVILPVPIRLLLYNDIDFFLNFISNSILGNLLLLDIRYEMNGILRDSILFYVRGNVSVFLEAINNLKIVGE